MQMTKLLNDIKGLPHMKDIFIGGFLVGLITVGYMFVVFGHIALVK